MIKVDQFCFRFDLKTGAIIIGVVHLIMGITYASVGLAEHAGNIGGRRVIIIDGIVLGSAYIHDTVAISAVIMGVLNILVASSLLYGTIKRKAICCMMPFLVVIPLQVVIAWIILLLYVDWLYALMFLIVKTIIYGYFWVCVFSFWNLLNNSSTTKSSNANDSSSASNRFIKCMFFSGKSSISTKDNIEKETKVSSENNKTISSEETEKKRPDADALSNKTKMTYKTGTVDNSFVDNQQKPTAPKV